MPAPRNNTAAKKKVLTLEFDQDKTTANAVRFSEVLAEGQDRGHVGSIYLLKSTLDSFGIDPEAGLTVAIQQSAG